MKKVMLLGLCLLMLCIMCACSDSKSAHDETYTPSMEDYERATYSGPQKISEGVFVLPKGYEEDADNKHNPAVYELYDQLSKYTFKNDKEEYLLYIYHYEFDPEPYFKDKECYWATQGLCIKRIDSVKNMRLPLIAPFDKNKHFIDKVFETTLEINGTKMRLYGFIVFGSSSVELSLVIPVGGEVHRNDSNYGRQEVYDIRITATLDFTNNTTFENSLSKAVSSIEKIAQGYAGVEANEP